MYVNTVGIYTYYCSLIGQIFSLLTIRCPINAVVHGCITQPGSAVRGGVETSPFASALSRYRIQISARVPVILSASLGTCSDSTGYCLQSGLDRFLPHASNSFYKQLTPRYCESDLLNASLNKPEIQHRNVVIGWESFVGILESKLR